MASKALPKKVKVGGWEYSIRLVPNLLAEDGFSKLAGSVYGSENRIDIEKNMSVEKQWQVLWHELLHAFLSNAGYHDAHSESIIDAISMQITWVLSQNGAAMLPNE